MKFRLATYAATALIVFAAGCATPPKTRLPSPLPVVPASDDPRLGTAARPITGTTQAELGERSTPTPPDPSGGAASGVVSPEVLPPGVGSGPPITMNFTNLPLPTFINEVIGNSLGLTFQIEPEVQQLSELVTLRTSRPQPPAEFYRIARQVLADYGVEMIAEGDIVRVRMAPAGTHVQPPIIYSGRALPDVPLTHRPVFFLMQLDAIRANEAARWLRAIYGDEIKAEESSERNALLLSGRSDQVRQAVEAIKVFDRPSMRGRASIRLEPAFLNAADLAGKLTEVLVAEGYGAASSLGVAASVLVLPVPAVNSVILFASDTALLRHAVEWARELDRPNPAAGNRSVFYYPVQNTKAADIATVLGEGARERPGRPRPATLTVRASTAELEERRPGKARCSLMNRAMH